MQWLSQLVVCQGRSHATTRTECVPFRITSSVLPTDTQACLNRSNRAVTPKRQLLLPTNVADRPTGIRRNDLIKHGSAKTKYVLQTACFCFI